MLAAQCKEILNVAIYVQHFVLGIVLSDARGVCVCVPRFNN